MPPNATLTSLRSLANSTGTGNAADLFGGDAAQRAALRAFVAGELKSHPELAETKIRVGPTSHGGGAYFPKANLVSVEEPHPALLGHELAHASSMTTASGTYKTLQNISRKLWNINTFAALPAALAVSALVKSNAKARILNALTVAALGLAAPTLYEETAASVDAISHAPDKLEAVKRLLPGWLTYAGMAAVPPIAYQLAKRFGG
jgi:hypothetical protein